MPTTERLGDGGPPIPALEEWWDPSGPPHGMLRLVSGAPVSVKSALVANLCGSLPGAWVLRQED